MLASGAVLGAEIAPIRPASRTGLVLVIDARRPSMRMRRSRRSRSRSRGGGTFSASATVGMIGWTDAIILTVFGGAGTSGDVDGFVRIVFPLKAEEFTRALMMGVAVSLALVARVMFGALGMTKDRGRMRSRRYVRRRRMRGGRRRGGMRRRRRMRRGMRRRRGGRGGGGGGASGGMISRILHAIILPVLPGSGASRYLLEPVPEFADISLHAIVVIIAIPLAFAAHSFVSGTIVIVVRVETQQRHAGRRLDAIIVILGARARASRHRDVVIVPLMTDEPVPTVVIAVAISPADGARMTFRAFGVGERGNVIVGLAGVHDGAGVVAVVPAVIAPSGAAGDVLVGVPFLAHQSVGAGLCTVAVPLTQSALEVRRAFARVHEVRAA